MKNYAFVESGHVHIVSDEAMIPKGAKWIPVDTMDVAYVRVLPDGSPSLRSTAEVEQDRQAAAEQATTEMTNQAKMREMAIMELKKEGKLPQDFPAQIQSR